MQTDVKQHSSMIVKLINHHRDVIYSNDDKTSNNKHICASCDRVNNTIDTSQSKPKPYPSFPNQK